jgi:hypothetical protein
MIFTYNHLKRGTSDIRLVRFKQPAQVDLTTTLIELELQHASFDDETQYAALSYVWGRPDTRTTAQVHINRYSFTIGSNLHTARRNSGNVSRTSGSTGGTGTQFRHPWAF